jgi:peptide-methionine (S)-S-oxide reductase
MRILDNFPDPVFDPPATGPQMIVLGGGCFWCTEGVFRQMPGVLNVESGYAGGDARTANYTAVCEGDTGHAEVIAITYDASHVSLGQILKTFFWLAHDPTQVNGQGNDIGTQYRSVIFYADDMQHAAASRYISQIDAAKIFDKPIATRLEKLEQFFPAETYHQNYASLNPHQGYIMGVAQPKIDKAKQIFKEKTGYG